MAIVVVVSEARPSEHRIKVFRMEYQPENEAASEKKLEKLLETFMVEEAGIVYYGQGGKR
ncbi:MAG: hypothetical protein AMDU3_IPLC00004G0028 [Thermoplasmatales archaeon I-plasma]|nr:MAG: hypothetical protein AMDU3_IPLC00004G0028 [Thermoplasmatales archaeon I-plasma]